MARTIKIILLLILGLMLFVFSYLFLLAAGFERTFLNYDFYEEIAEESEIGEELVELITGDMVEEMDQRNHGQDMSEQKMKENMISVVEETFDADWIESVFLETINSTLLWVKGSEDELELIIELDDRKEMLIDKMAEKIEDEIGHEPENFREEIEGGVPDEINVGELMGENEISSSFGFVQTLYKLFIFVPIILFLFFIVIFVLTSGWSDGLKWFFGVVFVSSICSALTFLLLGLLVPYIPFADTLYPVFLGRALLLPIIFILVSIVVFITVKIFEKRTFSHGNNLGQN